LLAFSSLAEQAGLEGLATGGVQPAQPGRAAGSAHVITVPAPATAPPGGDPRDALVELVRESTGGRVRVAALPPVAILPEPRSRPQRPQRPEPTPPRRIDGGARVAVAPADYDGPDEAEDGGPPYGHAYGYYKKKHEEPKPAAKHTPRHRSPEQPVYARSAKDGEGSKPAKAPKLQKVKKVKKVKSVPGHSNGKAKGHAKHAHKGKGKGHSKHGA
jgi:hypothetical protein